MPKQSEIVAQLQENTEKIKMVELALLGKQPAAIAREMGCSRQHVMDVLDEALADTTFILMERVERLHMINLLRLERLIEAAMPHAVGFTDDQGIKREPDRGFIAVTKDLIKLEIDWESVLYERRAKSPELNPDTINQTIMAHDDMYSVAQTQMEADWFDEYADMDAQSLIMPSSQVITDEEIERVKPEKHIARLEKKVNKLLAEKAEEEESEE